MGLRSISGAEGSFVSFERADCGVEGQSQDIVVPGTFILTLIWPCDSSKVVQV